MGVRFVHAADLHLGSPLETVGADSERLQEHLRDATYVAFERIIDVALDEDVDFVVLAGDLYDQKNRSVRANEFLADQFDRLADQDIPAYVIYGNHDPLESATTYVEFPDTLHEFDHVEPEAMSYPNADDPAARIWGQSYRTESDARAMYQEFDPVDDGIPTIGLLHTGLDPDGSRYVPCSASRLAAIDGIHYWALGHIHQPRCYDTDPPIIHPGIPQGRHAGELGPGGCLIVSMDGAETTELEYVPTGPVVWRQLDVAVGEDGEFDTSTLDGIQRAIESTSEDLDPGFDELEADLDIPVRRPDWETAGYVCRWRLTGRGDVHELLSSDEPLLEHLEQRLRESLHARSPFVYTDRVRDRTGVTLPDIEELRGDDRVIDEFYALMEELEGDQAGRDAMRSAIHYDNPKNVWQRVEDPEEVDDDKLALTEDRLDQLIERARDRVLNEIVQARVE